MTDGAPGSDGYPDSRIFQVSKTTTAVNGRQQSGGLYKILEDAPVDASLSFHWERLERRRGRGDARVGFRCRR